MQRNKWELAEGEGERTLAQIREAVELYTKYSGEISNVKDIQGLHQAASGSVARSITDTAQTNGTLGSAFEIIDSVTDDEKQTLLLGCIGGAALRRLQQIEKGNSLGMFGA